MSLDYYRTRRTIVDQVQFEGTGVHTGESCGVSLYPADPGNGITFTDDNLEQAQPIEQIELDPDSERSTGLLFDQPVRTVEHLLGALYGLGISDVIIRATGPEIPILDGSAEEFVTVLRDTGLEELDAQRELFRLENSCSFEAGASIIHALPASDPSFDVSISHPDRPIPDQLVHWEPDPESFAEAIAPARTFGFEEEAEQLREQGLALGAGLENTLVYTNDGIHEEQELRLDREPARHKLLDLLGDLALAGNFIIGRFVSIRGGHKLNHQLTQNLREKIIKSPEKQSSPPAGDGGVIPASRIRGILPHRYPFLLLDKILHVDHEEDTATAVKNVTINEEFFQGHFPDDPIMPGVLTLETIAQLGAACMLKQPQHQDKNAYFLGVDDVKFRSPVRPGDRLIVEVEGRRVGSRTGMMDGRALVNGELATEGVFKFMLVERDETGS